MRFQSMTSESMSQPRHFHHSCTVRTYRTAGLTYPYPKYALVQKALKHAQTLAYDTAQELGPKYALRALRLKSCQLICQVHRKVVFAEFFFFPIWWSDSAHKLKFALKHLTLVRDFSNRVAEGAKLIDFESPLRYGYPVYTGTVRVPKKFQNCNKDCFRVLQRSYMLCVCALALHT